MCGGSEPLTAPAVLLQLQPAQKARGRLVKMQILVQEACESPESLISNKFPGEAASAF